MLEPRPMRQFVLGIDDGGTVAKAGLFGVDGRELAIARRKTEMSSPHPNHTERDVEQLWQATAEAIREVLGRAGVDPREVAAVATTGHGNGLYLVDEQGQAVRPGIISTDTRAQSYVARWKAEGTHRAVLPKTMQSLWAAQPPALLAWLRDHEPEVLMRARWALMVKDLVRMRLTGEAWGELTDMSGTSLVDVAAGQYDEQVLGAFGIAEFGPLLPPLRRSEEVCGRVSRKAAEQTGLAEGTPVAGGLFDVDACALASGLIEESQLSVVAGTWSINQYASLQPVVHEDLFMTSRYCLPGWYLMMEASATSASNLEWFVSEFMKADGDQAKLAGRSVYDLCNELVAATPAEAAGPLFFPFLHGSNADPNARACLMGLAGWHCRGHVLRAIYEGVVFGHRAHYDRLLRFRAPPQKVLLTGGAAQSEPWVQMFADAYQLPVEVPAGRELGTLGAAICAAVAVGCYGSYPEAVRAMARVERVQEPDARRAELMATKYDRYQRVLAGLGPVWQHLG